MFTFNLSPKLDDIRYTTVTLTVFDHDRIRSDEPIGMAKICNDTTDESELEHWDNLLQYPGREIWKWHYLHQLEEDL
jgi:hypothetical protein